MWKLCLALLIFIAASPFPKSLDNRDYGGVIWPEPGVSVTVIIIVDSKACRKCVTLVRLYLAYLSHAYNMLELE